MMKQFLAASAVAMLAASPAVAAYGAKTKADTGTPSSHVRAADARGGYTSGGTYVQPRQRMGSNDSFWRINPITGPVLLATAPFTGGLGAYAAAPNDGYAQTGAPTIVANGQALGWDPDPNIRLQMIRGSVLHE